MRCPDIAQRLAPASRDEKTMDWSASAAYRPRPNRQQTHERRILDPLSAERDGTTRGLKPLLHPYLNERAAQCCVLVPHYSLPFFCTPPCLSPLVLRLSSLMPSAEMILCY